MQILAHEKKTTVLKGGATFWHRTINSLISTCKIFFYPVRQLATIQRPDQSSLFTFSPKLQYSIILILPFFRWPGLCSQQAASIIEPGTTVHE